jgi:hypothetical protein
MTNSRSTQKHNIKFLKSLGVLLLLLSWQLPAQTFVTHQYVEDNANIANPERGFYKHTETSSGSYSFLNENTVRGYRTQGITLILRLFYLNDFVSKPIPEQYLANMRQDFNTARAAGVKLIVRFAYTKKSSAPYGDATPAWVQQHIEQLAPMLKQNGDVIAVVQAGFIGAWGEWYYTDHFSAALGSPNATDWQNRRAFVNALLGAIPSSRAVQIRTPGYKFSLVESQQPLTEGEAFTETAKARLGHHNDCFLASQNDFGTYTGNIVAEKDFLEIETQFLPMGGETCNESVPISECPNALAEMKRFHWSYLNRDYHGGVLGSWQDGNCMPEVFQKLGYHLRLTKSVMQETCKPGGSVNFTIKIINDGWATPFNPRKVEVVLKNTISGKTFMLPLPEDPRRWSLSDTIVVNINAGLPLQVEAGEYKVFLHLPDPEKTLYGNPDYSIRVANVNTWQAETGFNDLQHTLTVSKSASVPTYIGGDYFKALPAVGVDADIVADGDAEDWTEVPVLADGLQQTHFLKAFNTADKVLFLVQGISDIQSFEIKVDVDYAAASGELSSPWNVNHADYRVTSAGISFYQSGSWSAPQAISFSFIDNVLEMSVPRNLFSDKPLTDQIDIAAKVVTNTETLYLPVADAAFASYRLLLTDNIPLRTTSSGNKIILYWANESSDVYRTIERSVQNNIYQKIAVVPGSTFTYIDQVADNATVHYRTYLSSPDGFNVSSYAEPQEEVTGVRPLYYVYDSDGHPGEWEGIVPLATVSYASMVQAYRMFISAEKLNLLFEGSALDKYTVYFNMDNSGLTGSASNPWNYDGFDYMIRNDSLYDMRNVLKQFVVKGLRGSTAGYMEVSLPLSAIENLGDNTIIHTAGVFSIGSDNLFLPAVSASPAKFLRTLPSPTPSPVTVINSENFPDTQLIVQWQSCSGCKGFIVERAVSTPDNFSVISTKNNSTFAHYDSDLTTGATYYYKVSSYNDAGPSVPSAVLAGTPGAITGIENDLNRIVEVYPNPTTGALTIESRTPGLKTATVIDPKGQPWLQQNLSTEVSKHILSISHLPPGIYFVKVSGRGSRVFRIVKR